MGSAPHGQIRNQPPFPVKDGDASIFGDVSGAVLVNEQVTWKRPARPLVQKSSLGIKDLNALIGLAIRY